MTDLVWSAIRADTIDRYHGQTPRPEDEAFIIDLFEIHPQLVLNAIDQVAQALEDGKVTWAWSALKGRLDRGTSALREATADPKGSKLKAIERARQWIDNAGIHYDHQRHIKAELFGDDITRGRLTDYQLSDSEREQLMDYWREQRHRGEQAERNFEAWAEACRQSKAALATKQTNRKEEPSSATESATGSSATGGESSNTKSTDAESAEPFASTTPPKSNSTDSYSGSEPIPDPDADIPTKTPT